jgi:hypothetical protein
MLFSEIALSLEAEFLSEFSQIVLSFIFDSDLRKHFELES